MNWTGKAHFSACFHNFSKQIVGENYNKDERRLYEFISPYNMIKYDVSLYQKTMKKYGNLLNL